MPDMARYDPFSPTCDHPLLNSSPDYGSRNGSFRNRPIGDIGVVGTQMSFRERNKRLRSLDDEKNQLVEVRHPLSRLDFSGMLTVHAGLIVPARKYPKST